MRTVLKRNSDPSHVIMAKNRVRRGAYGEGQHGRLLERAARDEGYATWDAFCAAGRRRLLIPASDGGQAEIPTGLLRVDPIIAEDALDVIVSAMLYRGMFGDALAPVVAARHALERFRDFSALGMIYDGSCAPGRIIEAWDAHELGDAIAGLPETYEGLIWIDQPLVSRQVILDLLTRHKRAIIVAVSRPFDAFLGVSESVLSATENATLLRAGFAPISIRMGRQGSERRRGNQMWYDRAQSLLFALRRCGVQMGPNVNGIKVEDLRALEHHSSMAVFLDTLPGYRSEGEIDPKTREQLGYLTMQIRPAP